jgi:proteasome activator-like protein
VGTAQPGILDDVTEDQGAQGPPRVAIVPAAEGKPGEDVVEEPGKLLRIASMIRGLIEEAQRAQLDERGRDRLAEIYRRSVSEIGETLSDELRKELEELAPPLEHPPSESEVRVAQAQLLGWLEGLFHGIQAALWTQQMQARAALEEMRRRSLPPGASPAPDEEAGGEGKEPPSGRPGQYL